MDSVSSRAQEKRRRILDAARDLILKVGLRSATMEAIAKAAGIAKPTLYAQFSDKEALFEALIEELVVAKTAAFTAAFEVEGPLAARVGNGLAEKFGTVADLLENSPHAEELIGAQHRLSHRLETADDAISGRIARALAAERIAEPERITAILIAACSGILTKFSSGSEVRRAISLLCERMIGGRN